MSINLHSLSPSAVRTGDASSHTKTPARKEPESTGHRRHTKNGQSGFSNFRFQCTQVTSVALPATRKESKEGITRESRGEKDGNGLRNNYDMRVD